MSVSRTTAPTPTGQPAVTATIPLPHACDQSIVYQGIYQNTHSLILVDACSQKTVFLTDDKGDDGIPKWSPDGQYIAFLSDRGRSQHQEYRDLWLMNAENAEISRLTDGANIWPDDSSFAWSPNGNEILYSSASDDENKTWIMNLGDKRARLLRELWGPFSWSPDGSKIALAMTVKLGGELSEQPGDVVVAPSALVVVRPDGEIIAGDDYKSLYSLTNSDLWLWAPHSLYLAVAFDSSLRGMGGDLELVTVEKNRLVTVKRLQNLIPSIADASVKSLAWSPNNREIAFVVVKPPVHNRPYWGQVYVVDRDFTRYRTLTPEGMYCDGVKWSADGSQLVFACDDGEPNASIWLVNADGSNLRAITKPAPDVRSPQWRPAAQP